MRAAASELELVQPTQQWTLPLDRLEHMEHVHSPPVRAVSALKLSPDADGRADAVGMLGETLNSCAGTSAVRICSPGFEGQQPRHPPHAPKACRSFRAHRAPDHSAPTTTAGFRRHPRAAPGRASTTLGRARDQQTSRPGAGRAGLRAAAARAAAAVGAGGGAGVRLGERL
jgi:hypothetical protein